MDLLKAKFLSPALWQNDFAIDGIAKSNNTSVKMMKETIMEVGSPSWQVEIFAEMMLCHC